MTLATFRPPPRIPGNVRAFEQQSEYIGHIGLAHAKKNNQDNINKKIKNYKN